MSYSLRVVLWCDHPRCRKGFGGAGHGRKTRSVGEVRKLAQKVHWVYVSGKLGPFNPQDRAGDVKYWPPLDLCPEHGQLDPAKVRAIIDSLKQGGEPMGASAPTLH